MGSWRPIALRKSADSFLAHERLVRGEQIGRILEESANPRLPRRVVVDEETVCRAAVIELLELVTNAVRSLDVLKHRAKPDHRHA